MFHKLFPARSSRPLEPKRFPRLELEPLEDRLAPVAFAAGPFPADLMGNLQTSGPTRFSVLPASAATFGLTGFVSSSPTLASLATGMPGTASLNGINTTGTSNTFALTASGTNQLAQLQQQIMALFQLSGGFSSPAAVSLVTDEFALAFETFTVFLNEEHSIYNPSFVDLPARESAINQNPLLQTAVGRSLGSAVFLATADLLASAHPGAGVAV